MNEAATTPLNVFRFHVDFHEDRFDGAGGGSVPLCQGSFAECTGLEATMEPKVIKEGGRNYGPAQRAGPVTFATVILKRGLTTNCDLWNWFAAVNVANGYASRLAVTIRVQDTAGHPVLTWKLRKALAIKFKMADLNAKGTEVGVEELHIAHEGLTLESPAS